LFGRQTRDRAEVPHIEGTEWNTQPHRAFPDQRIEDAQIVAEMPFSKRCKRPIAISRGRPVDLERRKATIYLSQLLRIAAAMHQFHYDGTRKAKRRVIESAQPTQCGEIATEDIDNYIGIEQTHSVLISLVGLTPQFARICDIVADVCPILPNADKPRL
jgi:hypothetical protein